MYSVPPKSAQSGTSTECKECMFAVRGWIPCIIRALHADMH